LTPSGAVRGYTEVCNMTFGKDHRTYDLALAILHEEIEHEAWFSEFIGEGLSGHALRKSGENSPYVGKFLGARQAGRTRNGRRSVRPAACSGHLPSLGPVGAIKNCNTTLSHWLILTCWVG
jgi:hypothetical protein